MKVINHSDIHLSSVCIEPFIVSIVKLLQSSNNFINNKDVKIIIDDKTYFEENTLFINGYVTFYNEFHYRFLIELQENKIFIQNLCAVNKKQIEEIELIHWFNKKINP